MGNIKKHAAKYESQQKTLELALESLEYESKQNPRLSSHEHLWMSIGRDMRSSISLVHKSIFDELIDTADCESLLKVYAKLRSAEYLIVWYYKNLLKNVVWKKLLRELLSQQGLETGSQQ